MTICGHPASQSPAIPGQGLPSWPSLPAGNDPKHTSRYAKEWYLDQGVNWWKTPAASPDLNPIENVWHALKDYLRKDFKPRNLSQLREGIKAL